MIEIIQDYIPKGKRNRPGIAMKAEYITIHDTANTARGADAKSHAKFLKNTSSSVSWHFTVDDKVIVQHLPVNEVGWHAGDGGNGTGNRKSIGIEICENADGNRLLAEFNASYLTARLMYLYNINKVVQHNYWTGKDCPRILRKTGRWKDFLDNVQRIYSIFVAFGSKDKLPSIIPIRIKSKYIPGVIIAGYTYLRALDLQELGHKVQGLGAFVKIS